MARYHGPRVRVMRRLGIVLPGLMKLSGDLKSLKRKNSPGEHGANRKAKLSDYALRLREKQKLRYNYGLSEKQIKKYLQKAYKSKKNPSLELLSIIESRLDNIVYRIGFARSIQAARQMIVHGHILVNNKKLDKPSALLNINDKISYKDKENTEKMILSNYDAQGRIACPVYLKDVTEDSKKHEYEFCIKPGKKDILIDLNEQLIIEFYSGKC